MTLQDWAGEALLYLPARVHDFMERLSHVGMSLGSGFGKPAFSSSSP